MSREPGPTDQRSQNNQSPGQTGAGAMRRPPDDNSFGGDISFDELRRELEKLPPEARQRVMRRMIDAIRNAETRAPRNIPAPDMGDVRVPPPQD